MRFEDAIAKLEKIVAELEEGNLTLDESLKRYEEGIRYVQFVSERLDEVRRKVDILTKTKDGKLDLKPFK